MTLHTDAGGTRNDTALSIDNPAPSQEGIVHRQQTACEADVVLPLLVVHSCTVGVLAIKLLSFLDTASDSQHNSLLAIWSIAVTERFGAFLRTAGPWHIRVLLGNI